MIARRYQATNSALILVRYGAHEVADTAVNAGHRETAAIKKPTHVGKCEDGKGCCDCYADPNTSVDLPGKTGNDRGEYKRVV